MRFEPKEKVVVKTGYEVWDREGTRRMRKVVKDGQVIVVVSYDEATGGYICDVDGEQVFMLAEWLTEFKET
jgi:hypothetical protein